MAKHNVVIKKQYAAYNVDSYNRSVICDQDVDNGSVCVLKKYSKDPDKYIVWEAEQATAASKGLWMIVSPEVNTSDLMDGVGVRNLIVDPRAFYNVAGKVADAIKLVPGDIIEMTGEGIENIEKETTTYLVPDTTGFKLKAATAAGNGLALRKIKVDHLNIGDAAFIKGTTPTYWFEVEQN